MKADPSKLFPPEPAEPTARKEFSWLLMVVILLMGIMVWWAWGYTDDEGGGFNGLVYEPYHSTNQLADFLPKGEGDLILAKGKSVYAKICAPCHMDAGTGDPTRFIPPLAGSEWVTAPGANRIIRIVLNGLNGPITVKGQQYSGTAMLAWKDTLSDEEIAAVLTYTRSQWGNKASAVKPEQVKKVRAATADRSDNWSPDELLKMPDSD
jgi:mono/diheme cytochrome c family protein